MKSRNLTLGLSLLLAALLAACGSPGVPIPPSLELPRPVTNLRASRKGDTVTLTWSTPTKTTDQHNIRHPGTTQICRDSEPMKQCVKVAEIPFAKPAPHQTQTPAVESYTDSIPVNLQTHNPLAGVFYAVSVENSYRRSAGLSNQAEVPVAPTLPPPANFRAQLNADGVHLSWDALTHLPELQGLGFLYRVYRHELAGKTQVVAAEVPAANSSPAAVDSSFEWEKTYEYRVTVVTLVAQSNGTEQQIEGDDSPVITVVAHDTFPPATPSGLQAVFSGPGQKPFIDLVWNANTEADFAGYNVYRSEEGATAAKINSELVKSPAFRDTNVVAGHTYLYSVSAVDVRGNESPKSEETSETVPAQ
ncbi:MAG TPA: hypothetical protein VF133_11390 [Terriglobales bacterium]